VLLVGIPVAGADWMDYMKWTISTDDVLGVCFYEPQDELLKEHTDYLVNPAMHAVITWYDELKAYSGGDEYDIEFFYIPSETYAGFSFKDFQQCNIHIAFWEEKVDDAEDITLGVAWNLGNINGTDMSAIEVYPIFTNTMPVTVESGKNYTSAEIDEINSFEVLPIPQDGIYSIVLHEFGHAIGLGHYCDVMGGLQFESVMVPSFDALGVKLNVTEFDLASVWNLYGEDGWDSEQSNKLVRYGSSISSFPETVTCT
jgi:hypothetical protein